MGVRKDCWEYNFHVWFLSELIIKKLYFDDTPDIQDFRLVFFFKKLDVQVFGFD